MQGEHRWEPGKGAVWTQVPYDMEPEDGDPPKPYMSKNEPWRARRSRWILSSKRSSLASYAPRPRIPAGRTSGAVRNDVVPGRGFGATLHELGVFASQALADFRVTAALAPSSRHLARAMLQPLCVHAGSTVVEIGAGTGAITAALLASLPTDATLLALEVNPRFFGYLTHRLADRRLVAIHAGVEALAEELRSRRLGAVDAVVSSVALGYLSDSERRSYLGALMPHLAPDAVLTQYQYLHGLQYQNRVFHRFDLGAFLAQYFRSVERRVVWRNLPPAYVFTGRQWRNGDTLQASGTDEPHPAGRRPPDLQCRPR